MLVIYVLPVVLVFLSLRLLPISVLFGCSGTAYLCAMLYNGVFKKFEPSEDEEFPATAAEDE